MSGPGVKNRGGRDFIPIVLRISPEMLDHIDKAAAAGWRSRTSEMLRRLAESMEGESFDVHGCIVKQVKVGVDALAEQKPGGQ